MLLVILRKIISNKWLVGCLLIGSILLVGMVSTVPMYSNGVFQRMLTRDLERFQEDMGQFPGTYEADATMTYFRQTHSKYNFYRNMDTTMRDRYREEFHLPILTKFHRISFDYLRIRPETRVTDTDQMVTVKVEAIENLPDNVEIRAGRMFSTTPTKDGVFEVVMTDGAMRDLGMVRDRTYVIGGYSDDSANVRANIRVQVVGVIAQDDPNSTFWFESTGIYNRTLFMDFNLAREYLIDQNMIDISYAKWHYALDYHKMSVEDLDHIVSTFRRQNREMEEWRGIFRLSFPVREILTEYHFRHMQLSTTLWILYVPVLIMLAFYIFMVSRLIVKHEENEISVMKSRGASRLQIFKSYLMESSIYSVIALVVGPMLGLFLVTLLGASDGFMEFINRTALPISLTRDTYLYSVYSLLLFMLTMLIPAYISSRSSIVEYKQKKSKKRSRPLWNKLFLDIILLGGSIYGLINFQDMQDIMNVQQASETGFSIDPLLFFLSTFFILGAGLFFLRVYPTMVKIIFALGKRFWSPVMYSSFIQVGRSGGQEQFLMLFLIVSLSVGIFNANAARTINQNIEDRVMYHMGTDIVVEPHFRSDQPPLIMAPPIGDDGGVPTEPTTTFSPAPTLYIEPDYTQYERIEGIDSMTKVYRNDRVNVRLSGRTLSDVDLMAVISHEFGETAWFRDDLLPYHWYNYLNLLADNPRAVLVSSNLQQEADLELLDELMFSWGNQSYVDGIIYGFIDYWPTWNPVYKYSFLRGQEVTPYLIVSNLSYIHNMTFLEPYQIWIKRAPGTTDLMITNQIEERDLRITGIDYAAQRIIQYRSDPLLQGINGTLTLSFIVTMLISIIGFLIYWILSIRDRVLQFGILRAMGLSRSKLIGMIVWEQILISAVAIFIGLIIGSITSTLFVPLLQVMYAARDQVPPFEVMASTTDYVRIYIMVGVMLVFGVAILSRFVAMIKMDQAVKLGED